MSEPIDPNWWEIPSAPTDIRIFTERIQAQYMLKGVDRMGDFIVLEIRLFKTWAASRHEYISIKLRAPNGRTFYLAIERGRGDIIDSAAEAVFLAQAHLPTEVAPPAEPASLGPVPTSQNQSRTCLPSQPATASLEKPSFIKRLTSGSPPIFSDSLSSVPLSSSPSTLASLDSLLPRRYADDKVSQLGHSGVHHLNDEIFRTLSFHNPFAPTPEASSSLFSAPTSPRTLPFYQLVVLADTLHELQNEYLLFSDNCFFYAGTIIKVIQELYNPVTVVAATGSKEADETRRLLTGLKKTLNTKPKQAGSWNGIEIYAGERIDTAPLKEKFTKNLEKFTKPVQAADDARNKDAQALTDSRATIKAQGAAIEAQDAAIKAKDDEIRLLKSQLERQLHLATAV